MLILLAAVVSEREHLKKKYLDCLPEVKPNSKSLQNSLIYSQNIDSSQEKLSK